jgi:hypothetical protein
VARVFDHVWLSFQSGLPLTEAELTLWEQSRGVQLPPDYRSFMLRCNGGVLRPFAFVSPWPELTMGDPYDVLSSMFDWREVLDRTQEDIDLPLRNVPPDRLAIGHTESELTIMLRLDQEHFGSIEAWPTNVFDAWGDGQNTRVVPLAPTFSAFIEMLHDIDGAPHYYWARVDPGDPIPQQVMLP